MSHVVARFTIPAVYAYDEWKYSALRVVVTDTADKFLMQYLLTLTRS